MMKVLEVNVDDVGLGGVYALVNSVIRNKPEGLKLDIACIAEFENPDNLEALKRLGTDVYYVGTRDGAGPGPGPITRTHCGCCKAAAMTASTSTGMWRIYC